MDRSRAERHGYSMPSADVTQVFILDKMAERRPKDIQTFCDRRWQDRLGQDYWNLCLLTRELRCPEEAYGPFRQPPLDPGHCQAFRSRYDKLSYRNPLE
jgi:hypothetical protein